MTKRRLAAFAVLAVLLAAPAAVAQEQYVPQSDSPQWLKDRRYNEGEGLRAGDLEIHPGIAAEYGYDSNWFLRSDKNVVQINQKNPQCGPPPHTTPCAQVDNGPPNTPIISALELRVSPSIYLSTLGPRRREGDMVAQPPDVAFRAGVNATVRQFTGLTSDPTPSTPNDPNDISRQDNIGGSADARLDILPERPFGAGIFASYARLIFPNAATADPGQSYTRDDIGAGGEVIVQPGGGTLDWRLGYQFHDYLFESTAGAPYDTLTHELFTRGRWRFRPRTALIYDATLRFTSYNNSDRALQAGLVSSTPVRARIGLNGLVTDRFATLLMVGWGSSFIDSSVIKVFPQYDSVIGQAELKWFLTASPGIAQASQLTLALSTIAVGYTRDFMTSYLGNFAGTDRGYVKFSYFFGGRAVVTLDGGLGAIEYPTMYFVSGGNTPDFRHASFTDLRVDGTLFGEYRFADWFGVNATVRYTQNISSNQVLDADNGAGVYDMAWSRIEAFAGVRLFM